ncbi:peptidylprolyl isomerase [Bradyrhizobium sp. LHD-71]
MRILLTLVLLAALSSGGCTKCGWVWDNDGPKSCRVG